MRLLVLGGTKFLGRPIVDEALARGHEVTLFTRGRTNADLYPQAEKLHGDRDGDLSALDGRGWDAVVDDCGYVPRVVRAGAELLRDRVDHYTFVSTIGVYASLDAPGVDEQAPMAKLEDESSEDVREHYGALKAACEQVVREAFGERALIVRPGLIVGPHDPTNRFTYWVSRIARGGDALVANPPGRRLQFVDVRDLGEWMVRLVEERRTGIYNAVGPAEPLTMEQFVHAVKEATGSDARFVWVDEERLLEAGVEPWSELPLWLPRDELAGMMAVNVSKALAAGLSFRPLAETIRDTLAWETARAEPLPLVDSGFPPAGLAPEREAELLATLA